MTEPGTPDASADRLPMILGGVMLIVVVIAIVYALVVSLRPAAPPPVASLADLERALAAAKKACVEGPPQGPSCVEAARLTTEVAERGRRPQ